MNLGSRLTGVWPAMGLLLLTATSCSSEASEGCIQNETRACTCLNGSSGVELCLDGQDFSACQCGAPADPLTAGGSGGGSNPVGPQAGTGGVGGAGAAGGQQPPAAGTSGGGAGGGQPPDDPAPTAGAAGAPEQPPTAGAAGAPEQPPTAGAAGAPEQPPTAGAAGAPEQPPRGDLCLQGSGDYTNAGPYQTTQRDVDIGGTLGMYTVFYPSNMEANCPHPIAAWGNGTTVTGSGTYAFYHTHAASWGIVVIASHDPNAASQPFLEGGLDWLLQQNNDPSSEFYQKLSTRAGVSGHSQGAMAATTASNHPNVEALVQVQGGGMAKQGVAVLALTGTADTIVGTDMPTMTYNSATGPACLANYEGADHITTPTLGGFVANNPGTIQYMRFYTMWYRCFLADDEAACAMFRGNPCPVCTEPGWAQLETKNM